MAILDLQRREAEAGRVRFGNKVGSRPNRLDHPLLTSPDRDLVEKVSKTYGGAVEPWPGGEDQWMTPVPGDLAVIVPISPEPFTSWWERWSGGGCLRRCDGFHDQINDAPCDCDKEADQRACKPTTRWIVLLPETGEARWRVETKSLHAALDIPAALEGATGEKTGEFVTGVLRVSQRKGKKGNVPVPTITLDKSGAPPLAPEKVVEPVSDVVSAAPGSHLITDAQRRRMFAMAKEHGVSTEELKLILLDLTGQDSSKAIPSNKYEAIIAVVETGGHLFPEAERQEDVA